MCVLGCLPEFVYIICMQVPLEAGFPGARVVRELELGTEPRSSVRTVSAHPPLIFVLVNKVI